MKHQTRILPVVAALTLSVAATGCTSVSKAEYAPQTLADYPVEFDAQTNRVELPLDRFVLRGQDAAAVEHANALLSEDCMQRAGFEFPRASIDWSKVPPLPDTVFGLWSPNYASTIGYTLPTDPTSVAADQEESKLPQQWWTAWDACLDQLDLLPLSVMYSTDEPTVADIGRTSALDAAQGDPRWKSARSSWVDCLAESGLSPDDAESLRPTTSDDPQVELRTAEVDVACKRSTNLPELLADIVAEEEMDYINQHRAELEELRSANQETLQRADEIIKQHP